MLREIDNRCRSHAGESLPVEPTMWNDYLAAAARKARYEILPADGCFYGEIECCPGVHGTGATLEECRTELLSTLEDWVLFRIHRHLDLPVIDGYDLTIRNELAS
jgi:predicted RNase H-like HicB family nuclease